MIPSSTTTLIIALLKRFVGGFIKLIPNKTLRLLLLAVVGKYKQGTPIEWLVSKGETVMIVGTHRIDTVMLWSFLVGPKGKVIVVEAISDYLENIRKNLEHHLNWPLSNIVYIAKGVDSTSGLKNIQIGEKADFNKLANQSITDGLLDSDFVKEVEIETDTIDQILASYEIDQVDHIQMTISGMEVEALKGMRRTLEKGRLRLVVRSLHEKEGKPLYREVSGLLKEYGFTVSLGRRVSGFVGRDVFAYRV